MKLRKILACVFCLVLVLTLAAGCGQKAEKYPGKPITIVVGFAPGGGLDIMSRAFAEEMKKSLGVDVVVQNMPGANGAVALDHVSKQPKDGYTIIAVSNATCTYPATGVSKLSYKDFGLIGIPFGSLPMFSVPASSPIQDGKAFIEELKKGNMTGSNSGIGGISHIPQMVLTSTVGAKFKAVPYEGGGPAGLAIAKKEVDFGTNDPAEARTLLKEKMIRPLFVISDKPYTAEGITIPPVTNFVPEMKDKITTATGWRGFAYAKGVPADRVKILTDAIQKASETEAIKSFADKNMLVLKNVYGAEADKIWEKGTQIQSWLLYDLKEAKQSPEVVGIPRP